MSMLCTCCLKYDCQCSVGQTRPAPALAPAWVQTQAPEPERISDDEILSLWRTARPDPGQDNEMTWVDFDDDVTRPRAELRKLVELVIERERERKKVGL